MSKLYCEELRKVHQEIQFFNQKLSEAEKEQKNELVLEVVNRIIELAILARKEGFRSIIVEGDSNNLLRSERRILQKKLLLAVQKMLLI